MTLHSDTLHSETLHSGTDRTDRLPRDARGPRRGRWGVLGAVVVAVALAVVGCGGDDGAGSGGSDAPAAGEEAAKEALDAGRTVIDVRTPEEYAVGHVEDAELIDVQSSDFNQRIAELDPDGDYVVYCRSGNRSAAAAATRSDAGLDVWDGGGLGDMESAGWPTVTG